MAHARCPRCGGTYLSITETHEEHGKTDFGQHDVKDGKVFPASEFYFEPGNPIRVEMECGDCGYEWRSRRVVGFR